MDESVAESVANTVLADIYYEYSGRGMFGETTTGVVVSPDSVVDVARHLAYRHAEDLLDPELIDDEEVEELEDIFEEIVGDILGSSSLTSSNATRVLRGLGYRSDNLAREIIIY